MYFTTKLEIERARERAVVRRLCSYVLGCFSSCVSECKTSLRLEKKTKEEQLLHDVWLRMLIISLRYMSMEMITRN